jgi:plastocyanin
MLIRMLALSLLAPLVLLAACGDDDDDATTAPTAAGASTTAAGGAEPKDVAISAADFTFNPATVTAAPGQTVNITLTNGDSVPHSFTVGTTDVTEAEGGEEATGEFTATQQTTEFHCKFHPQMTGTITVTAAGASNPNPTSAGGISGFGY